MTAAQAEAPVGQAQGLRRKGARAVAVTKARTPVALRPAKLPAGVPRNKNPASKMIQRRRAESRHRSQTQHQKLHLTTILAPVNSPEELLVGMPLLPYRESLAELA